MVNGGSQLKTLNNVYKDRKQVSETVLDRGPLSESLRFMYCFKLFYGLTSSWRVSVRGTVYLPACIGVSDKFLSVDFQP